MGYARRRARRRLITMVAGTTVLLMVFFQVGAIADNGLATDLGDTADPVTAETNLQEEGEEEAPPQAAAEGVVVDLDIAGQEIVTIGHSSSEVSEDDSSEGHATSLSVLGQRISGADADSENAPGGTDSQTVGYLMELCGATGGAICVALLYAHAEASENDDGSSSRGDASVLYACVGGDEAEGPDPGHNCSGPVSVGLLESHSRAERDENANRSSANESTDAADICIGGEDENGKCTGLGIVLLHSDSEASSQNGAGESDGQSYLLGIESGGEDVATVGPSGDLPPGCAESEEAQTLCAALNQGESSAESGAAGNEQVVATVDLLEEQAGGEDVAQGIASQAGTQAQSAGGPRERPRPPKPKPPQPQPKPPGPLPVTGSSGALHGFTLFGLMLILLGAGALLVVEPAPRRRLNI